MTLVTQYPIDAIASRLVRHSESAPARRLTQAEIDEWCRQNPGRCGAAKIAPKRPKETVRASEFSIPDPEAGLGRMRAVLKVLCEQPREKNKRGRAPGGGMIVCSLCPPDDNEWPASSFTRAGNGRLKDGGRICNDCWMARYRK